MKKSIIFAAVFLIANMLPTAFAGKKSIDISMFPAPKAGFKQVIIEVPEKKNENNLKIELFVGKEEMVDCNRHFMVGSIKEEILEGWGYNYLVVESNGLIAGTRMGCPDNKMSKEFIHMESQIRRYNSKLPIVIYLPESLDVTYRIWKAGKKQLKATTTQTGVAAVETPTHAVENRTWQLVELQGVEVQGNADSHYIILNSVEKRAQAKAGCNIINLPYELKNEFQISFGDGMSTMMACHDDELEQKLIQILKQVDNLSYDGKNTMTLNRARMMPLAVFKLVE